MRTIAVVNQKGGCGKTTVSINLASALAAQGKKVLLVDMDPQSHCAVGLAVPEEQIEQSVYDVLISETRNEPIRINEILWQICDRLELAPSTLDLAAYEQQMAGIPNREDALKNVLEKINTDYDYTVIDCPPAVGLLTFNALRAATDVVVPVETGYFALHGLSKQLETLNILCKRCSQAINVKVLTSMYDIRTKMAREILAELRSNFNEKMFKTVVNFNTKLKEAASLGQPITEYDPASKGMKDFRNLADEIIEAEPQKERNELVNSLAGQLEAISMTADEMLQSIEQKVSEQLETEIVTENQIEPDLTLLATASAEQIINEVILEQNNEIEIEEDLDAKIAEYYGVTQTAGAVMFVSIYPKANNVQIAGDFNNWQPENTIMKKVNDDGVFKTQLDITPGKYRYRYVVDGIWMSDPFNDYKEMNPFGEYNSVIEIS